MESCELKTKSIEIKNGDYKFKASGSMINFDGFMKIYEYNSEEEKRRCIPAKLRRRG